MCRVKQDWKCILFGVRRYSEGVFDAISCESFLQWFGVIGSHCWATVCCINVLRSLVHCELRLCATVFSVTPVPINNVTVVLTVVQQWPWPCRFLAFYKKFDNTCKKTHRQTWMVWMCLARCSSSTQSTKNSLSTLLCYFAHLLI